MKKKLYLIFLIILCDFRLFSQITFSSPEEAAEYALINSPEYNYNRLNTELAMKISKRSITDFLPSISLSWSDNKTLNYNSADSNTDSFSISVNQFLFDGGKKWLAYEMGKTSSFYSYREYLQSEKEFRSQIIAQYFECINQKEMLDIKKDLLKVANEQLEILKTEYELGITLENDYLEYLIKVKKLQNECDQYKRQYEALLRKFKIALSLSTDVEVILTKPETEDEISQFFLDKHIDYLWERYKTVSPAIQKLDASLYYAKKQYAYSKKQYMPEVSFSGNVTFSGETYPLTQPNYTFKINIAFSNFPILPVTTSTGAGLNSKGKLNNFKDEVSTTISPQLNYVNNLKANEISIKQKKQEREKTINEYYENFFDIISQHDDYTNNIIIFDETIKLQERRLEISLEQVNSGRLKRLDYLNELIELSTQKIQLIDSKNNLLLSTRTIEIMLDIPFGGLQDACK